MKLPKELIEEILMKKSNVIDMYVDRSLLPSKMSHNYTHLVTFLHDDVISTLFL
jgi:hypothetical protein